MLSFKFLTNLVPLTYFDLSIDADVASGTTNRPSILLHGRRRKKKWVYLANIVGGWREIGGWNTHLWYLLHLTLNTVTDPRSKMFLLKWFNGFFLNSLMVQRRFDQMVVDYAYWVHLAVDISNSWFTG